MTSTDPDTVDDTVRSLRRLNWSTRKIASQTGLSQSTIVRILNRINSGPHPVSRHEADAATDPMPALRPRHRTSRTAQTMALWVIALAILLLAGAACVLAVHAWQPPPAVPVPAPARIIACAAHGTKSWDSKYLTGVAASHAGSCPAGWRPFLLSSGG